MINNILQSSYSPLHNKDSENLDLLPIPLRNFLRNDNQTKETATSSSNASSTIEVETQGRLNSWFSQADADPLMPRGISYKQRILGFLFCLITSSLCICLAMVFLPVIMTPYGLRKYVLLHTTGSILLIGSFSFLWGPWNHIKSLFGRERALFTFCYLFSLVFGLYSVIAWKSAVCAGFALILQITLVVWFILTSIPGGKNGLLAILRGGMWVVKGVSLRLPI